ncbi:MAG TPA: hypothetical protein VJC03_05790 [bacterium]|nr:hypothetical protein [bacterium]
MKKILVTLLMSLWLTLICYPAPATGLIPDATVISPSHGTKSGEKILKILSALEKKMEGQELSAKVKDKIASLSARQVRLITSLSERMSGDQTMGSDIAFLLISALIILS